MENYELVFTGGASLKANESILPSKKRRNELDLKILEFHEESKGVYGSPRIFTDLKAAEIKACENTVAT